ncbi:hypothetical protein FD754_002036 [Muntiacus muntjak]|uniref:DDE-1 domain-containing protein n=1 Tax=Muntiacus muntjak TaxID=9888 RepID=A0A5N3W845_MUNMU|nr:hypothetical protein FD754_002036 [Muntiacus muntjak]
MQYFYFKTRMSGNKCKSSSDVAIKLIERMEKGEKMVDTAHSYNRNHSTTGIILKNKGKIMEHVTSAVLIISMIISKKYGKEMEEMEKLLIPLSLILIQEKAKGLYEDLKKKHSEESRAHLLMPAMVVSGEAMSANTLAAQRFPEMLQEISDKGEYLPEQIFNVDQKELSWKRMPWGAIAFSDKAAKDRLNMLFGDNASNNLKLKPLLVCHSKNLRALKNIAKGSFPVVWKSNPKTWVSQIEKYCLEKDIPFNILLLLNNSMGYPPCIDNFHSNIKVQFWKDCNIYKARRTLTLLKSPQIGFGRTLLAFTNEDLMELETQSKDEERREEDVTEELKRFMMQVMARGFSLFEETLLVFDRLQQLFRIQSSAAMPSMMRERKKEEQLLRHHWITFTQRVARIESSKEPEPVPSASGGKDAAACPPSPIAEDPSAPPSPTASPSSGQ